MIFDIETESNPKALEFMPEPSAPSNYKNPESIAKYVEAKKQEWIEGAALDPDYGRIVAIAIQEDERPIQFLLEDEVDMIEWFWRAYEYHKGFSCGYNILNFDLPYLLRRSFALGIKPTRLPNLARYRTHPTLDLMAVLYNWGQAKSLKWVCRRYGIENPLPGLDGSKVKEMDAETLEKYVCNDVRLTYELWKRMRGIYF